jgi:hypothetical protein
MRQRIPHWLRFLAPRSRRTSRPLSSAKGRPMVVPTRPVLECLERREMPGDVLGGFFISALGVMPIAIRWQPWRLLSMRLPIKLLCDRLHLQPGRAQFHSRMEQAL